MQDRLRLVKEGALRALVYSDIFDFPLTLNEITKYFVGQKKVSPKEIERALENYSEIEKSGELYYAKGRMEIVKLREGKENISRKKVEDAKKLIEKISICPSILLVGISGGLALGNSEENDDIDLFVVVRKNTIWTTRAVTILILILFGKYRRRSDKNVAGKICLNMLVEEDKISLSRDKNLYTAREIVQLMPIFERENYYGKFLNSNKWVLEFMPNSIETKKLRNKEIKSSRVFELNFSIFQLLNFSITLLNPLAKKIQMFFINKHRTIEHVSDSLIAFHPYDYKSHVLREYNKRLKKYGLY